MKRGYIRGIRRAIIAPINSDGTLEDTETIVVDTPTAFGCEPQIKEGEKTELHGGDRLLMEIKDADVITGATLSITDARLNLKLQKLLASGSTTEEDVDGNTTSWDLGTIETQQTEWESGSNALKIDLLIRNYNETGNPDGYLLMKFRYGKGKPASIDGQQKEFSSPEYEIVCEQSPHITDKGAYGFELIETLPDTISAS